MNKKYILPGAFAILMMASCADEFDPEFVAQKPANLEKMAELAEFQPLKEYIDRSAHPDFKLGAALSAPDFSKKLTEYNVAVTNFDEVVAGNAMKYASCVDDKGNMDFGTVNTFVLDAVDAGITVYGHTLAWHAQQRPKYLNSLLADKPKPQGPAEEVDVQDAFVDWGSKSGYDQWGQGGEVAVDGALHITNPDVKPNFWECQYIIAGGINTKADLTYKVTVEAKAEGTGTANIRYKLGDWGGGGTGSFEIEAGGDYQEYSFQVASGIEGESFLLTQFGDFVGTVSFKTIKVSHVEMQSSGSADVVYEERFTPVKKRVLKVASSDMVDAAWDTQFWFKTNDVMHAGDSYELSVDIYAYKEASIGTQLHKDPGSYVHWSAVGNFAFTTDWETFTATGTIPDEGDGTYTVALNLNDQAAANTYYFANFSFKINGKEQLNNGDLSGDDNSSFFSKESRGDIVNTPILDEYLRRDMVEVPATSEKYIEKRCIIVETDDLTEFAWDSQFWIQTNEPFHAGDSYEFTAEVRADIAAAPGTQIHKGSAGGYLHWSAIGNTSFTTEWETVKATGTIPDEGDGGNFIAWNLNDFAPANRYYFGSISFKINGVEMLNNTDLKSDDISSFWKKEKRGSTINSPISDGYYITEEIKSTIPLTPEEKHDTLVWAMDKWIAGMMEACEGHVKAWDVVNEAIAGDGNDGGFYTLQHGSADNANDFFWQDGMGDLEYVRQAVRLARKYYAKSLEEKGGDDGKLKLFINDYNLESDWDNNHKVKSLINWIKRWEEDGVTKIDGIGTQMHISYYEDAKILESKKNAIVNSFKLMAATGKLVRISELDMGYVKKDGKDATLDEMTDDMEKQMEEYYKWIIEQYFANVPANQQYGITQWCLTDSPKGSGWRADTPVGIWDLNWNRKYIYRGWTEGLAK